MLGTGCIAARAHRHAPLVDLDGAAVAPEAPEIGHKAVLHDDGMHMTACHRVGADDLTAIVDGVGVGKRTGGLDRPAAAVQSVPADLAHANAEVRRTVDPELDPPTGRHPEGWIATRRTGLRVCFAVVGDDGLPSIRTLPSPGPGADVRLVDPAASTA